MIEIISQTILISSCRIHYLEAGNRKNKTVILLHGMKFQAETWKETGTLQHLADNGFHAIAVDMPGFGKSPTCELQPDAVLEHFIADSRNEVVLVGPSMGGRIALEFALTHPASLAGLVLVGAVGVKENSKRLPDIHIPTLIVWGSEDRISPMTNFELLYKTIPGSEQVIIAGAPHPCYLDNAEIWHRELVRFLNSKIK